MDHVSQFDAGMSSGVIDAIFSSCHAWAIVIARESIRRPSVVGVRQQSAQIATPPSILDAFRFWLIWRIERATRHQTYSFFSRNLIFFNLNFNILINFSTILKNATPLSILVRFRFWLICIVDIRVVHQTYSFLGSNFKFKLFFKII